MTVPAKQKRVKAGAKTPPAKARAKRAVALKPGQAQELFARLASAMPSPKTELEHINPYTLLVAVVLSAQATDAGVNKATRALFAKVDTPAKMVALGEARVRDYIKSIGLFRTKARNIVRLSELLISEHGGAVPQTREA